MVCVHNTGKCKSCLSKDITDSSQNNAVKMFIKCTSGTALLYSLEVTSTNSPLRSCNGLRSECDDD